MFGITTSHSTGLPALDARDDFRRARRSRFEAGSDGLPDPRLDVAVTERACHRHAVAAVDHVGEVGPR